MQFLEEEILEITESTWAALLGLEIQPCSATDFPSGTRDLLTGEVHISGAWNGVVFLQGTAELARTAAGQIFNVKPPDVTEQDQIDAVYELSNIITGNIKSLLPEPCQLALPTVQKTTEAVSELPGASCMSRVYFECHGQTLLVTVWKND